MRSNLSRRQSRNLVSTRQKASLPRKRAQRLTWPAVVIRRIATAEAGGGAADGVEDEGMDMAIHASADQSRAIRGLRLRVQLLGRIQAELSSMVRRRGISPSFCQGNRFQSISAGRNSR